MQNLFCCRSRGTVWCDVIASYLGLDKIFKMFHTYSGYMIKCLLTELGQARRENVWLSFRTYGPSAHISNQQNLYNTQNFPFITIQTLTNDGMTEVLLIRTWYQLKYLDRNICLHIGDNDITLSPVLKFRSPVWWKNVHVYTYHQGMRGAFFHLHNIRIIRNIDLMIFCEQLSIPLLLLDSVIVIAWTSQYVNFWATACPKCSYFT